VINDPDAAIEHLIGLLPPETHDATCWWAFTASQNLPKTDPAAPGLLFWSEVPLSDAALKRWVAAINNIAVYKLVDPILFDSMQAHHVAAPVLSAWLTRCLSGTVFVTDTKTPSRWLSRWPTQGGRMK
jgi:hypothetical protein